MSDNPRIDRTERKSSVRVEGIAPGFHTSDMRRSVEHYRMLGFEVDLVGGTFAIASRDGLEIQLLLKPSDEIHGGSWLYLRVNDADALYDEWNGLGIVPLRSPSNAHYGLRDGSHTDPDGNIIMFGSRLSP